jgi:small subunit ribosomal protein S20
LGVNIDTAFLCLAHNIIGIRFFQIEPEPRAGRRAETRTTSELTSVGSFVIISIRLEDDVGTKRHAKKRLRQSLRRRERNRAVRSATRTVVKRAVVVAEAGSPEEAAEAYKRAQRAIDVAARKGVIHKRAAARKKSRLARRVQKAAAKE